MRLSTGVQMWAPFVYRLILRAPVAFGPKRQQRRPRRPARKDRLAPYRLPQRLPPGVRFPGKLREDQALRCFGFLAVQILPLQLFDTWPFFVPHGSTLSFEDIQLSTRPFAPDIDCQPFQSHWGIRGRHGTSQRRNLWSSMAATRIQQILKTGDVAAR